MTAFAGSIAEVQYCGHEPAFGHESDIAGVVELAMVVCGSTDETEEYSNWLWHRTRNLITNEPRWTAVVAVADALLKSRTLTPEQTEPAIARVIPTGLSLARVM